MKNSLRLNILIIVIFSFLSSGCMLSYVTKNGISQVKLLLSRKDINKALKDKDLTQEQKRKLELVIKVRDFCLNELKLKKTKNYSTYAQLKQDYVSYLLRVAPKYELKSYEWSFPIMGKFPYLGFFNKQDALKEQIKFKNKNYDTYVRGVTAYSSLGWFNDPVLSSMLRYDDFDLVDLIIHETIHTTLFIKDNANFNERLATFLARVGTKMFYQKYEGSDSKTNSVINDEYSDDQLFSVFITQQLEDLKKWYQETQKINDTLKESRLKQIQTQFELETLPKMKTKKYQHFVKLKLNNARLLPYLTYMMDLSDFEKLHKILGDDFHKTLEFLKKLENSDTPESDLKAFITKSSSV